jgi:hypothetical protein
MARWDDEQFNMQTPANNIKCATCKYRLKPVTIGDYTAERYGYGNCDKYDLKPQGILWDGDPCEYYEEDDHEENA